MPLPPGTATTLWRADERFKKSYFEKFPVSICMTVYDKGRKTWQKTSKIVGNFNTVKIGCLNINY